MGHGAPRCSERGTCTEQGTEWAVGRPQAAELAAAVRLQAAELAPRAAPHRLRVLILIGVHVERDLTVLFADPGEVLCELYRQLEHFELVGGGEDALEGLWSRRSWEIGRDHGRSGEIGEDALEGLWSSSPKGARWSSTAIGGTRWHSVALGGTRWHSVPLRCTRGALSGAQWLLSGTQKP